VAIAAAAAGLPGERQVTNPEQDIDNTPQITQSETTIAADFPFILMGFNDSRRWMRHFQESPIFNLKRIRTSLRMRGFYCLQANITGTERM
jgi:hypothetical protein